MSTGTTLKKLLHEGGGAGLKVVELLEGIQAATGVGGTVAAEALRAIDAAITAALASADVTEFDAALEKLRTALPIGEAADDAAAQAIINERFPKGG